MSDRWVDDPYIVTDYRCLRCGMWRQDGGYHLCISVSLPTAPEQDGLEETRGAAPTRAELWREAWLESVRRDDAPRSDPALRALLVSARAGVVVHQGCRYALTWWE